MAASFSSACSSKCWVPSENHPEGFSRHEWPCSIPRVSDSDSIGLGWGPSIYIPTKVQVLPVIQAPHFENRCLAIVLESRCRPSSHFTNEETEAPGGSVARRVSFSSRARNFCHPASHTGTCAQPGLCTPRAAHLGREGRQEERSPSRGTSRGPGEGAPAFPPSSFSPHDSATRCVLTAQTRRLRLRAVSDLPRIAHLFNTGVRFRP